MPNLDSFRPTNFKLLKIKISRIGVSDVYAWYVRDWIKSDEVSLWKSSFILKYKLVDLEKHVIKSYSTFQYYS